MKILGATDEVHDDKNKINSNKIFEYPLVPLKNLIIFPTTTVPFVVGRKMSVSAVEEAMKSSKKLVVAMQKNVKIEIPKPNNIYDVGTIVDILQILKIPDGTMKVLVEGVQRVKINKIKSKKSFLSASCSVPIVEVDADAELELEVLVRNVIQLFESYLKYNKKLPAETIIALSNSDSIEYVANLILSQLPTKPHIKQKLLSIFEPVKRFKELSGVIANEIEMAKVSRNINEKVRKNIEKNQKEYFLHEQLKQIKKELGNKGDYLDEIDDLKKQVKKVKLPKEIKEKVNKEIHRLEKMPLMSSEASVIRTYIEWLLDLPWNIKTDDKKDIKEAAQILDEDHYGLKKVKERILEYIAVRQLVDRIKGQILCFIGPPGVGKTSLGKSIARALNRNFVRVSLGGVRDEAEIRGHRRTYVGSLPGRIIQGIKKAKSKNPVFLLDEIDKMSTDFRGDPSAALLEVLDPEQNNAFSDHYIETQFDLSDVFFITTANSLQPIPRPLLDRMELIFISGYTENEKVHIAVKYLIPRQLKEHGLSDEKVKFSKNSILHIIRYYTREAGVRELERTIASLCRKAAKKIVGGDGDNKIKVSFTPDLVSKFLGPIKFRYGEAEKKDEIGVATGLAWTEAGGDILAIEVSVVPGTGKLIMTGKLGEVFQESAQAAMSYARSKAEEYKIPVDFYKDTDVHIHVPEGAVPKDGPSAGITIATALISALSKIPVRKDVAMTGEVTLRGKVLPIGGLKEKVLAAHRSNINNIILPYDNKKDFEEIPKQIQKRIKFYFVENMDQVLKIALKRNGHISSSKIIPIGGEFFKENNKKKPGK